MRLLAKSVVAAMGVAMGVAAVARASRRYAFGYEAFVAVAQDQVVSAVPVVGGCIRYGAM